MNALGCLLSSAMVPAPGSSGGASMTAHKCIAPEVLSLLRGALARCSRQELARLRLSGLKVLPTDPNAHLWVFGALPLLMSPRSPVRRPVTVLNLRDTPIDVLVRRPNAPCCLRAELHLRIC